MKALFSAIGATFFLTINLSGQQNAITLPETIPPSPNMSALAKFVEQPVDKYSGLPDISIPLYNIQSKDIRVPIGLKYHAGGRKVEEVASWVGLGWSIFTGGSVIRSVRGLPDDLYSKDANVTAEPNVCVTYNNVGYLYCGSHIDQMYNFPYETMDSLWFHDYMREIGMGAKDGIPDMFYFSFGNYSGEFVFDKNGGIKIISQQDLIISVQRDQNGHEIIGFTITTPEGLQYIFNSIDRSTITSTGYTEPVIVSPPWDNMETHLSVDGPFFGLDPADSTVESYGECFNVSRMTYNSAWHLTKIVSLPTKAQVDFLYRRENVHDLAYTGESLFWWDTTDNNSAYITKSAISSFIRTRVIDSIKWDNNVAVFHIDTLHKRKDLDRRYGKNYWLDSLTVKNNKNRVVKSYKFYYNYFISDDDPEFWYSGGEQEMLDTAFQYRLRLSDLKEDDMIPYTFYYSAVNMTHRASSKQDFWGYYCVNSGDTTGGNTGNKFPVVYRYPGETVNDSSYYTTKFSIYPRDSYTGSQEIHTKWTVDRSPNDSTAGAWMLEQINYPTGGSRSFLYELNEFYIDSQKIKGGGLRLKKQYVSDAIASYIPKTYDYHESGKIVDLPLFASSHPKGSEGVMYHTSWSSGLGLTKGSFVGYSKVSEITPSGKITDTYLTPAMFGTWNEELFQRPMIRKKYYTRAPHTDPNCQIWFSSSANFDFYPRPYIPNYDWKRGVPSETSVCDSAGNLLKRTKNYYLVKDHSAIPNMQIHVVKTDMYATALGQNLCFAGDHCYNLTRSYDISPWFVKDSSVTIEYANGDSLISTIKYFYEGGTHKQLTKQRIINFDGTDDTLISKFKYAPDYTTPVPATDIEVAGLKGMQDKNMKSIPVEITGYVEKNGASFLRNSILNTFQFATTDSFLVPYKTYVNEPPYDYTAFQQSTITSGTISKDSNYRESIFFQLYDTKSNLSYDTGRGSTNKAWFWSYNGRLPVAEITNCIGLAHNAFSSFEAEGKGNWSYTGTVSSHPSAPTGENVYNLSGGDITKSSLSSGVNYVITYWKRDSAGSVTVNGNGGTALETRNGWVLYQHAITGITSVTISGTALIDELRLHPAGARMITITYEPLVGMTSQCGVANKIIYYKYDTSGRLIQVLDQDRNILQVYEYKYLVPVQNQ